MRAAALRAAGVILLAGPTILAFFSGGYFPTPRGLAGLCAWILVAIALALSAGRIPTQGWPRCALGGLALLALWTLTSTLWAPIAGNAYGAGATALLYVGVVLAATLLLQDPLLRRGVEPVLAAGALIVVGYGLSERLLPGLLTFSGSVSAEGRLEQPLTYWNAMGELAAIGFVLCAALTGAFERPPWIRALAAAGAAPLGLGLYISFSRGAIFACAAGLLALVVLAPTRGQLRAVALTMAAAVLAAVLAAPLSSVTSVAGALATRERQGAIALVGLGLIAGAAAAVALLLDGDARGGELRLPRHAGWLATGLVCLGLGLAVSVGSGESSGVPLSGGASRLVTLQSNRYDYWRVALHAFAHEPVIGVGAGGWAVWWLRQRPYALGAHDAHSLELQTLAELGIVGFGLLAGSFTAFAMSGAQARRRAPALAAGPLAALVVWLAHSPLDWDWQMPAVTLIAAVLAGAVLGLTEPPQSAEPHD